MSDKKHIDRLFQEKLKDFEASPSKDVWANINKELNQDSKDRKVIPLWLKLTGAAMIIGGLFILGNSLLNDNANQSNKETIVNSNTENKSNNTSNSNSTINDELENIENNNNNIVESEESNSKDKIFNSESNNNIVNNKLNNNPKKTNKTLSNTNENKSLFEELNEEEIANDNPINNKEKELNKNIDKERVKELLNASENSEETLAETNTDTEKNSEEELSTEEKEKENAIEEAIASTEDETEKKEAEAKKRWSVTPNVSPIYFNSLGEGSSIHPQFVNNTKTGDVSMSYGITGTYAINDKLSLRAGVNKLDLGYSTNDVIAYNDVSDSPYDGHPKPKLKLNAASENLAFMTANAYYFTDSPTVLSEQFRGSIDQDFGFIEIPLEIEYKLVDKKINLRLIGGGSALFLNENKVYITSGSKTTYIGQSTNINKTSFTANFGLGVDFEFSKKVRFNLEPMFKYQFNTFSDVSGNFKPYFIGVYSGFIIKL